jgi:hypothetical protein
VARKVKCTEPKGAIYELLYITVISLGKFSIVIIAMSDEYNLIKILRYAKLQLYTLL